MIYARANKNNSFNVHPALLLSLLRSRPSKLAHNLVHKWRYCRPSRGLSLPHWSHSRLNCSSCSLFAVLCVTWCWCCGRAHLHENVAKSEQWLMQIVKWKSVHRSLEHSWQWLAGKPYFHYHRFAIRYSELRNGRTLSLTYYHSHYHF